MPFCKRVRLGEGVESLSLPALFRVFLLITVFSGFLWSADYILLGLPVRYAVFNKYEQPVEKHILNNWPKGVPFKIVQSQMTLGDGLSKAMQCSWHGVTYYLVLTEDGGLKPLTGVNKSHVLIKRAKIIGDTAIIVKNNTVRFAAQAEKMGPIVKMQKGERVFRIFRKDGRFYVLRKGSVKSYGWSRMTPASGWKKSDIPEKVTTKGLDQETIGRIDDMITQANHEYRAFYSVFNQYTQTNQPVPQWARYSEDALTYSLSPEEFTSALNRSHRVLVEQLNDLLFGTGYRANRQGADLRIINVLSEGGVR